MWSPIGFCPQLNNSKSPKPGCKFHHTWPVQCTASLYLPIPGLMINARMQKSAALRNADRALLGIYRKTLRMTPCMTMQHGTSMQRILCQQCSPFRHIGHHSHLEACIHPVHQRKLLMQPQTCNRLCKSFNPTAAPTEGAWGAHVSWATANIHMLQQPDACRQAAQNTIKVWGQSELYRTRSYIRSLRQATYVI